MPSSAAIRSFCAEWRIVLVLPLAFAGLCATASQSRADWARCASEGGACTVSNTEPYLIRYGANGQYFFVEIERWQNVNCSNEQFGEPAPGAKKACDYMPVPQPAAGNPAPKTTWTSCAPYEGTCVLPAGGEPRMVRYGRQGFWGYSVQSGAFPCKRAAVVWKLGANHPTDTCEYASEPYLGASVKFADCASEGSDCTGNGDVALVRYGRGDSWIYKIIAVPRFNCHGDDRWGLFKDDPAPNEVKFCQVAAMPSQFTQVAGGWHEIQSCRGACTLQKTIAVSVTGSRQKTVTTTWAQELSVAIEKSFGVPAAGGGKVSASFKVSHSEAVALQEALSHQETKTQAVTCSSGKDHSVLYQWSIDADEMCYVGDGHCQSSVSTLRYLCAVDPPAGHKPVCAPEACIDALCTKCNNE